ncbi:MAG: sugar ABC transporter permease, partial [Aristaeellaceae bacterium]
MVKSQQKAAPNLVEYKKPSIWRVISQNRTLILMCVPAIVFFFVFSYMPMPGAYIAFTNFQYNKGIWGSPFVGLKNFAFLFSSGQLTLLLRNTILYNLAFIILGNVLQLLFAILLNEVRSAWFKKTSQSLMFLPYFISDVLV